jgi:AcrR family transcriptional regulator
MAETKESVESVEYITVAEFAEKAGVSKQAVYQRLNKKLKPYVKMVDGAKMLNTKALEEVYGQSVEQGVEQELEQENQENSKENQDIIKALLEQLKTKDIQISELNERLAYEQRNHSRTQLLLVEKEHKLQMIEDLQKKQMEGKDESEKEANTSDLQPGEGQNISSEEIYKGMIKTRKWWEFWKR